MNLFSAGFQPVFLFEQIYLLGHPLNIEFHYLIKRFLDESIQKNSLFTSENKFAGPSNWNCLAVAVLSRMWKELEPQCQEHLLSFQNQIEFCGYFDNKSMRPGWLNCCISWTHSSVRTALATIAFDRFSIVSWQQQFESCRNQRVNAKRIPFRSFYWYPALLRQFHSSWLDAHAEVLSNETDCCHKYGFPEAYIRSDFSGMYPWK